MIHSLPSSEPLTAQKLFSKLYVSYYARLVRFASLYVGAMGDAENIVQDFFLYLWERKEILPELQQPDAYLRCQASLSELPSFTTFYSRPQAAAF